MAKSLIYADRRSRNFQISFVIELDSDPDIPESR